MATGIGAEEVVLQLKLGVERVGTVFVRRQPCHSHRVGQRALVAELAGHALQRIVVTVGGGAVGSFGKDGKVGHLLVGDAEHADVLATLAVGIVLVVIDVGEREVGGDLDAVADVVVEVDTGAEAVEALPDDGAALVVPATADAESGLVASAGEGEAVAVLHAQLLHGADPVGVVVELLVLTERGVVVELDDVASVVALLGIEVSLFKQHGVVVAVEHADALRLVGEVKAVAVGDAGRAAAAALGLDLDDAIGTLRAPDGCGCGILQHADALNIIGVDGQQLGKLLLVGIGIVEVVVAGRFKDIAIDHDEGLRVAVDGTDATQTHGGAAAEVAAVEHDVKASDAALQGFIDGGDAETFKLSHVEALGSNRHLPRGYLKSTRALLFDGVDDDLVQHHVVLQDDVEHTAVANRQRLCGIADVGNLQTVFHVLHLHGELSVDVGGSGLDNAIGVVKLHHVHHHQHILRVADRAADDHPLRQ